MKRIITCSDGTWNEPNKSVNGKPIRTNVQKIFDYILTSDAKGVQQIKFYDEGVGAEGSIITRMLQGATG
ncbi:MAG: phospholipase effector Tle1 domain-containing protein, partial [Flammeovirgaceae bacterium]